MRTLKKAGGLGPAFRLPVGPGQSPGVGLGGSAYVYKVYNIYLNLTSYIIEDE